MKPIRFSPLKPAALPVTRIEKTMSAQFPETAETPETAEVPAKTDPVLLKAYNLLKTYAAGTGSIVCVHDASFFPIPEMIDEIMTDKNICLLCARYRNETAAREHGELAGNPCNEMHIGAMKEAFRHKGSYTYTCELGFAFWTSPVYSDGRFIGALLGTGYRSGDEEEAGELFKQYSSGKISKETFREKIARFPRADTEKIRALAELLHICAESLSTGNEDYHEILRRRAEQQADLSAQIEKLKNRRFSVSAAYPIEKERELLAAVRRGENKKTRELLSEILAVILFTNPGDFAYLQCRATELAALIFRTDVNPGDPDKSLPETDSACIRRIQESKNLEELTDILYLSVERMTERVFSFREIRHAAALRRAERYILENFTRKISLKEIARASDLSAPYFSTIFREEMGENFSSYLNRLRVEKAGRMLLETDLTLSEIASSCGFEDQSWFSKIFKSYMGQSPGKYREQDHSANEMWNSDSSEENQARIIKL
ncbi:MAG: helix-turn-helix domain-containing protein [Treponema sp.]|jgi:AraC-like DNA-binding protein/ligand-binding sensor protein|nr:helix-turn-helix domain-containing protein [Treponema sp.]